MRFCLANVQRSARKSNGVFWSCLTLSEQTQQHSNLKNGSATNNATINRTTQHGPAPVKPRESVTTASKQHTHSSFPHKKPHGVVCGVHQGCDTSDLEPRRNAQLMVERLRHFSITLAQREVYGNETDKVNMQG